MKIVITGFAYSRQNFFDVFKFYPKKEDLLFILPSRWKIKNSIVFRTPSLDGIKVYKTWTPFYNSNLPVVGGLFKGWMPFLPLYLLRARFQGFKALYSASEPNLLTTIINASWSRLFGMKHIFFTWENISYERKFKGLRLRIGRSLVKTSLYLSSAVICGNSKAVEIMKSYGRDIPMAKIPTHGVDENLFVPIDSQKKETIRFKYGYRSNDIVFLFVGALGYRKGIHLALKAFKEISNNNNDVRFLIVGSGEYSDSLNKLAEELGLLSLVKFIPWLPTKELPDVFGLSDIFLYPSFSYGGWEEQFGYSIAEASLCELPVISTNSGSISEVVFHEKTGLLVKENNQEELFSAMNKLLEDQALRKTLGFSGRKFIIDHYSNNIIACQIHVFLEELGRLWRTQRAQAKY